MSNWQQVFARTRASVIDRIAANLKILLEQKHLYQSVTFSCNDLIPVHPNETDGVKVQYEAIRNAASLGWFLRDPLETKSVADTWLTIQAPDLKLFCGGPCKRVEAFNLVSVEEFLNREQSVPTSGDTQVFAFSYRCQSCKGVPEIFLVRRDGFKITNAGRSPIEHVDVPSTIPKVIRRFYSGAIVAHQSGQTLAALFLLRTLIEQWSRIATGTAAVLADQVLDAYMDSLPVDFKGRFASMRALYDDLSADLHAATGSAELFDRARAQIAEHFEARRLFGLPANGPAVNVTETPV